MSEQHYPLVLVTWYDSTTFPGWRGLDKMLELGPDTIQSTGFLLEHGEEFIKLVMSLSAHDNWEDPVTGMDVLVLPAKCVTKVEVLGLVSSCGCGESMIQEKLNEEDCWGAPEQAYCERCGEQVCICGLPSGMDVQKPGCQWCGTEVCICGSGLTQREVQKFMKPLETIKGDEALGRQLTLDEHLRRGGAYTTWPGLVENVEGPSRIMTHYVGDRCNPPHEEIKES